MVDIEDLKRPFWAMNKEEALRVLGASQDGLSEEEAKERLKRFGKNVIKDNAGVNKLRILVDQFKNPLIFVLVIAGVITLSLEDYKDSAFIFFAVLINTALGFYQENKAETAIANLRTYIRERVRVLREGREMEIDAENVVPGDILRLSPGMRIPADARVLNLNSFAVDESILTGESLAVTDKVADPSSAEAEIAEQKSMVFGGTLVNEGLGLALVVRTGGATEIGRIASMVATAGRENTPLQRAIKKFTLRSSAFLAALTVLVFGIGLYAGYGVFEMFLISVAVAVSAVPEGLPVALTVILAIGVERLAKKKGIVRKLLAAETLGSTTLVMTDKTGTLTEAKMKLHEVWTKGSESEVIELALINIDVVIENPERPPHEWKIVGRALESALVSSAAEKGILWTEVRKKFEVLDQRPFNSKNKFAAASVRVGSETPFWSYLGAPEVLLEKIKMSEEKKYEIATKVDNLAFAGKRVLAVAAKGEFYGLIAFSDPVRPQVKNAILEVAEAGIRTAIITGDHQGTAISVANEVGIKAGLHNVLTGREIREMTDEELESKLKDVLVFARVSPEDKLRIARLYKKQGEVVAMTGDGVNDAPALKEADIGVAVGDGTDVAKGAADLVILDNNFETIVRAIDEGRRTLNNIKKVIVYLFSNVFDDLVLIGGSLVLGVPLPLSAAQILWVNFLLDSLPAISLGFENGGNHLKDKPRRLNGRLLDPTMKFLIFAIGIISSFALLLMYVVMLKMGFDTELTRTFIFSSFSLYTLFLIFSIKDLKSSVFTYNPFSNIVLNLSVIVGVFFTLIAVYFPPLQSLLGTTPLPYTWMLGVLVFGFVNMMAVEFGKWIFRRR